MTTYWTGRKYWMQRQNLANYGYGEQVDSTPKIIRPEPRAFHILERTQET
jgi:hypothetical protein